MITNQTRRRHSRGFLIDIIPRTASDSDNSFLFLQRSTTMSPYQIRLHNCNAALLSQRLPR
jgi:hypothetical protein